MTSFFLSALKQNLNRLCWIRCILLSVQCLALAYAYFLSLPLAYARIGDLLLLSVAIIAFSFWRARSASSRFVSEMEFLLHLLADVSVLCSVLYLTGGASNPLVSLLLIPLTISAAVLPVWFTRIITGFSLVGYSALLFFYVPLDVLSTHHTAVGISPHIAGMWFTFLLSAGLITFFITRMAQALRQQERILQENREDTLRDEQVLALATLAAGAAHELGTPLSTMRVLLTELEHDTADNKFLNADIKLLGAQVERCKTSLQNIVQGAQNQALAEGVAVSTQDFLEQLLDSWRSLRPEIKLGLSIVDNVAGTELTNTMSLSQVLMNLLNNASEVSNVINIEASRHNQTLVLILRDHGPGIAPQLLGKIGLSPLRPEGKGMGIGLFLTHATLERIGGSISMENHPEGGSITRVSIPLASDRHS